MSWHADVTLIGRYAAGTLDRANCSSVEEHLLSCEQCRAVATRVVEHDRLDEIFVEVRDTIQQPRLPFFARMLVRLGVRDHTARLIAATPALTTSWFAAIAIATAWTVIASHQSRSGSIVLFLMLAPLIPLAGVAASYGPVLDPTFEVAVAAPISGFRLFLLRAGTVLATTIGLVATATLALPDPSWTAVAWLLPALALTMTSVALSTWFSPLTAAVAAATAWMVALSLSRASAGGWSVRELEVFSAQGQAVAAVIVAVAVATIVSRIQTFDTGRE